MLCSPHFWGRMDRWHQPTLLFSTGTTDDKHKACTALAVCLPCSRDSQRALEGQNSFAAHTNAWIVPIFCRKNCSLIENGKVIHLHSKGKLYPGYWSSRQLLLLPMDVEMSRMSGSLWKGAGVSGRWPTKSFCKDGFYLTSKLCMAHAHTHTQPGRGEPSNDWPWEGNEHCCLSLPSSLPCALFSPLFFVWFGIKSLDKVKVKKVFIFQHAP